MYKISKSQGYPDYPDFSKFLFAYCAQLYLENNSGGDGEGDGDNCDNDEVQVEGEGGENFTDRQKGMMAMLLLKGLRVRYLQVPTEEGKDVYGRDSSDCYEKYLKYTRDIMTDRGVINCLARETSCGCMNRFKARAKSMEKLGHCFGCMKNFPKETMMLCSRCKHVKYCSRKCQLDHWPKHKARCEGVSELLSIGGTSSK